MGLHTEPFLYFSMKLFDYYHGDRLIQYELKRTRRKTLGLYIYPDRRVQLRVPYKVESQLIEQYLCKSGPWIVRQLEQLKDAPRVLPLACVGGTRHYFRGRSYTLEVKEGRPQRVEIEGDHLFLYSLDVSDEPRNKRVLKNWYKQQAKKVFSQRLQYCWQQLQSFGLAEPSLRLRWMKTRWGSCSSKAVITLNIELIKYAETELDYVVIHELCHLREFNHGPKFYAMMDKALPDWRARKITLEARKR